MVGENERRSEMKVNSTARREACLSFPNKFLLFLSIPSWLFSFCALGSATSPVCYPVFRPGKSQVSMKLNGIAEEDSSFPGIAYSAVISSLTWDGRLYFLQAVT